MAAGRRRFNTLDIQMAKWDHTIGASAPASSHKQASVPRLGAISCLCQSSAIVSVQRNVAPIVSGLRRPLCGALPPTGSTSERALGCRRRHGIKEAKGACGDDWRTLCGLCGRPLRAAWAVCWPRNQQHARRRSSIASATGSAGKFQSGHPRSFPLQARKSC